MHNEWVFGFWFLGPRVGKGKWKGKGKYEQSSLIESLNFDLIPSGKCDMDTPLFPLLLLSPFLLGTNMDPKIRAPEPGIETHALILYLHEYLISEWRQDVQVEL